MLSLDVKDLEVRDIFHFLTGGVSPRPIALVSTISKDGKHNLAPFSFFNAFGSNPPIVGFSAARRGRDGTFKDTYTNLMDTKECVIQVVTHDIVEQVSLASTEYDSDIDEFVKSALTPIASDMVKPPRVKESPFQMEAKLWDMVHLGDGKGAGNLALCEIVKFHIAEDIFENGVIQPDLIDLVARNGGDYYTRASGSAVFEVEKPIRTKGIGVDQLPDFMKLSDTYTGNNLAQFGNAEAIPGDDEINSFVSELEKVKDPEIEKRSQKLEKSKEAFLRSHRLQDYKMMLRVFLALKKDLAKDEAKLMLEKTAKTALEKTDYDFAWKSAMLVKNL